MAATLLEGLAYFGLAPMPQKQPESRKPVPRLHVQLVVTPMGLAVPKLRGYHSSVLVGGIEYSFDGAGVVKNHGPASHARFRLRRQSEIIDFGMVHVDLMAFEAALGTIFYPGSYDLLRKNCNSFSDCAAVYLTGLRLPKKYRQAETIAHTADKYTHAIQAVTNGGYKPNPHANAYKHAAVLETLGRAGAAARAGP